MPGTRRNETLNRFPAEAAEFKRLAESAYGWGYQTKIARKFGVANRTVMRWANGHNIAPKHVMACLADDSRKADARAEALEGLISGILQVLPEPMADAAFEIAIGEAGPNARHEIEKFRSALSDARE
ncbi:hypothetical protein GN330_22590 [Nitratireductor sp. CAU 1489]|uniref:Uncharacterized protein n=1 Tax=Nitratireductor arenosus TaxID=2682096 RepID=A0A844QK90_9HYPH|nr:hypothetical protein [Nitratireductor arenosus]MVB00043.1 hypothetical protein [Nitratireductor arenosus]